MPHFAPSSLLRSAAWLLSAGVCVCVANASVLLPLCQLTLSSSFLCCLTVFVALFFGLLQLFCYKRVLFSRGPLPHLASCVSSSSYKTSSLPVSPSIFLFAHRLYIACEAALCGRVCVCTSVHKAAPTCFIIFFFEMLAGFSAAINTAVASHLGLLPS